jgi:hypothetical protein
MSYVAGSLQSYTSYATSTLVPTRTQYAQAHIAHRISSPLGASLNMSRLNQLLTLARSLPPTPMRVAGSPQLSDAIEAIANRSFPTQPSTSASTSALPPSGSPAAVTQAGDSNTTGPVGSQPSTPEVTLGPGEERAIDGMIQVIQRLKSDQHARQVSPVFVHVVVRSLD